MAPADYVELCGLNYLYFGFFSIFATKCSCYQYL